MYWTQGSPPIDHATPAPTRRTARFITYLPLRRPRGWCNAARRGGRGEDAGRGPLGRPRLGAVIIFD